MATKCCLCLEESNSTINIFEDEGLELGIPKILTKHFWFEPCPSNPNTKSICMLCWNIVEDFHKFYLIVEQAHQHQAIIKTADADLEDSDNQGLPQSTQHNEFAIDIKEELIDSSVLQEHLEIEINRPESNPLEDVETSFDTIEEHSTNLYPEYVQDMQIELQEVKREGNPLNDLSFKRKCSTRSSPSGKAKIVTAKQERCVRNANKKLEETTVKPSSTERKRRARMTERDDELLKKYISMGCELCPFVGENFNELTEHFREQHEKEKPYVVCCGRKLRRRFLILQHAYKHDNPEYYKCKDCNKVFSDGYVLRQHMLVNHMADEDLIFSCDKCPKKFSRRYLLDLHIPSHIPPEERTFWCNTCPQPKVFASEHLLQIHTNMRHKRAPNVCHVCAKEIRDNQAFEKHVRLHFEDSGPRVKCPYPDCDRWLKDEDNLKHHIRRHNDEGKIFKCDQCQKQCKNRRSLTSHIKYAHTNETFACEECNKTFKKALSLREHMAQHTGETLYKCPFCTRTFNSNANMHSHKKKMHPEEWDIWRKTKKGSSQKMISSKISELKVQDFQKSKIAGN